MKSLMQLVCCSCAVGLVLGAQAGKTFKFATGETTGYIDDLERWSGDSGGDRHCSQGGTIIATNGVSTSWYQFEFGNADAANPTILHIQSGAVVGNDNRPGNVKNTYGLVLVDEGGTLSGGANVGVYGMGIVTNNGIWKKSEPAALGIGATGHGVFVHNGNIVNTYPKNMFVGKKGWGELILNAPMSWSYNKADDGDVVIGQASQFDNRLVINDGATFSVRWTYVGGRRGYAGEAGRGTIHLRGGTYINCEDTNGRDNLFLGTATNELGEISADTWATVRGWGLFRGDNDSASRIGWRGFHAQLGRGEFLGDGEGDESRVLNLGNGLCYVTNVLFGTQTTSGWRAVNKGMVTLTRNVLYNGNVWAATNCLGCAESLDKPDLVNAVRMYGTGFVMGLDKSFGGAVLAPDRTDAHTNALPKNVVSVLGVWRLGLFNSIYGYMESRSITNFKSDFRYDQTKLTGSSDTRLYILRYTDASGVWKRVGSLDWGERPADCIVSIPDYLTCADTATEAYNLGTFAVVECEYQGSTVIIR